MLSIYHSGTDGNDTQLNKEIMRKANNSLIGCVGKWLESKELLIILINLGVVEENDFFLLDPSIPMPSPPSLPSMSFLYFNTTFVRQICKVESHQKCCQDNLGSNYELKLIV